MRIIKHSSQLKLPPTGNTLTMSTNLQRWDAMDLSEATVVYWEGDLQKSIPWHNNEDTIMNMLRANAKTHREHSHSRAIIDGELILSNAHIIKVSKMELPKNTFL